MDQDDMSIFNMECMQKALQHSQSNSSDSLRVSVVISVGLKLSTKAKTFYYLFQRQYSALFSLAWEDELPISRRARKLISNSLPLNQNLHSSNEDSEVLNIIYTLFICSITM